MGLSAANCLIPFRYFLSIAFAASLAQVLRFMAEDSPPRRKTAAPRRRRRLSFRVKMFSLLFVVVALAATWVQRERIVDSLITDTLAESGVPASYTIESIGAGRQVLTDLVIGDPASPDLTIERIEMSVRPRLGMPGVGELVLVNPRLYGRIVDGELSFGTLDPLIFTGDEEPFAFPDMELTILDGRALIEGDHGPIGIKIAGSGHVRGGFAAETAVIAPELRLPGCLAEDARLYGVLSVDAERPRFDGPLRFSSLACEDAGLLVADGGIQLAVRGDRDMAGITGEAGLTAGNTRFAGAELARLEGEGQFTFREGGLTASYEAEGHDIETGAIRVAVLDIEGTVRGQEDFARMEVATQLSASNVMIGTALDRALASAEDAGEGTLLAPLLARLHRQLEIESRGSTFSADITARRGEQGLSVVIPEARLRGASGASLLALSRAQFASSGSDGLLFSGNFASAGAGLPQIEGRADQIAGGALDLRLVMQEYTAGSARLALPALELTLSPNGSLAIGGELVASGDLPGGFAEQLALPLAGRMNPAGELRMWEDCTPLRFEKLGISSLVVSRQELDLCPPTNSAILRYDEGGLQVAAGVPSLLVAGSLGETPIRIASGPIGFAWPGAVSARRLDVRLGPRDAASHFTLTDLAGRLGDDASGTFTGADVLLDAVPLDLRQASGSWRFADGRLALTGGHFVLEDREEEARFQPLDGRAATLDLVDNRITADFMLHEPGSGQRVARVGLAHALETGVGHSDIAVEGAVFTADGMQPRDLSELAYGVVSLVDGVVTGEGRIDWNAEEVTSSGSFASERLDLAAAFGPVKGVSGTVEFTDLLGLTTAPGQRLHVQSVNPGIEVTDGEVAFSLRDGTVLQLEAASWPFLGGLLTMQPVSMNIGMEEERRYVFQIEDLEANRFLERMELNNIAATGRFDGSIPIVFDAMGNGRIDGGQLSAQPPGGHLSYVGQLTYEDLSAIGNFAFNALRDLQYDRMEVLMNGPLTGELVTEVRFDGIRQGDTAESNFLTRRIASLPIQLRVNIRAPFYQLITSLQSIYDPSAVRDPRGLGLLTDDGTMLRYATDFDEVERRDEAAADSASPDEPDIQPPESEALP